MIKCLSKYISLSRYQRIYLQALSLFPASKYGSYKRQYNKESNVRFISSAQRLGHEIGIRKTKLACIFSTNKQTISLSLSETNKSVVSNHLRVQIDVLHWGEPLTFRSSFCCSDFTRSNSEYLSQITSVSGHSDGRTKALAQNMQSSLNFNRMTSRSKTERNNLNASKML